MALPGYLKLNYGQDIRIEKQIAQGGSGNIFVGSILNVERKKRLGELADEFVIKRADDEDDFSGYHECFFLSWECGGFVGLHSKSKLHRFTLYEAICFA